ncbi:protein phosphatase CheZ [Roseospira visakhapatnamensis]|uniref:Chemotaxis protein CheZ n=1 Tax=Roseospira visakhapatnamensis TaxID=390880 RepID=A0A7W6RCC2_9PROT|nr:protein phosphatase CheZ [Roseospira visakhapatnamensis]MBB4265901.1 chemotaxis protein CheZ [Roseospira visakhapatnamensis]
MTTTRRPFTAEMRRGPRGAEPPVLTSEGPAEDGNAAVLQAIAVLTERLASLESRLPEPAAPAAEPEPAPDPGPPPEVLHLERNKEEVKVLRMEISALARCIDETKTEIAKLRDQQAQGDRLTAVAHELDAIVGATESATNGILDIIESVASMVSEIQAQEQDSYIRQLADDIQDKLMGVFEHCNFQDLTGQRITKVVNTMKFIEERIDHMMDIWGRDGFLVDAEDEWQAQRAEEEKRLLNGPQIGQKGISQDEIDALFD